MSQDATCMAHAPESWWPSDKRCDKAEGHRGPHIAYRSIIGECKGQTHDDRCFYLWHNGDKESVYHEHHDVARERAAVRREVSA